MRLTAVSIFDIMTVATPDDYDPARLENLAQRYIEAADRRRCLAGNLPILLADCGFGEYTVLSGNERFMAALLACRRVRWITRVSAIVVAGDQAAEADAQLEIEEIGLGQFEEAPPCGI